MISRPFFIHALSPLHAGTGQSAEVIDLPIARMRSTGIPFLPGSSIRGVLRDARSRGGDPERAVAVFGPETDNANDFASAVSIGDARLLALPVRSFRGTFAWVTSPLLLELAKRDLAGVDGLPKVPEIDQHAVRLPKESTLDHRDHALFEDLDLPARQDDVVHQWARWLAEAVFNDRPQSFTKRFAVVDDETMTFFWETATQVDTRVRLDHDTRTVASGALWFEESLPPETLLVGLMVAHTSRSGDVLPSSEVATFVMDTEETLQFGGHASIGRGRCRLVPAPGEMQ